MSKIMIGGTYWSNELERVTIARVSHEEAEAFQGVPTGRTVVWYVTTTGKLFDASRLSLYHPGTGERA